MRRIVIALGVIVGVFFIVRAVVELLTIDYFRIRLPMPTTGRTEHRGRAPGSLRAGADRGRLDRCPPMATTFEPIERAKAMN